MTRRPDDIPTTVTRSLRTKQSEIHDAVMRHIAEAVPLPRLDDAAYLDGLRRAVSASIDYSFRALTATDLHDLDVPPPVVAQAQRAARLGLGIDFVLLRYVAGFRVLDDLVMREAEGTRTNRDTELRNLRRSHIASLQRLISAVADAYRLEIDRINSYQDERAVHILRLLAGEPFDASVLLYALEQTHTALIINGPVRTSDIDDLAYRTSSEPLWLTRGEDATWAWLGSRSRVTSHDLADTVRHHVPTDLLIAIGEPGSGVDGFQTSHREAQAAHLVALRTSAHVTCYADIAPEAFALGNEPLALSLTDIYLTPLAELRSGTLVLHQTLRAYFALDRNVSSTAAHLGVARHTVEQRLRRVEKRLGRQLTTCSLELEFALRIEAVAKSTLQ